MVFSINKTSTYLLEVELTSGIYNALSMTWYGTRLEGAS